MTKRVVYRDSRNGKFTTRGAKYAHRDTVEVAKVLDSVDDISDYEDYDDYEHEFHGTGDTGKSKGK